MKKIIVISLFLFLPLFSHASFTKDLYYGVRGDAEVQALQEFLADQGHYMEAATGNFFSLTLAAVKKFQIANNISPASGYFGPKTRAKVNQILEIAGISADSVKDEDNMPIGAPVVAPKTANDVVASLANQITLLQQQLATLQKNQDALQQQNQSLQVIQQQQAAQTQTLQQIQQNTKPPLPSPIQPVAVEIDKSEILVQTKGPTSYGSYIFWVRVLDKAGRYVNGAPVRFQPPADMTGLQEDDQLNRKAIHMSTPTSADYFTTFEYIPNTIPGTYINATSTLPTPGERSITFTSGNLSKTVTVTYFGRPDGQ